MSDDPEIGEHQVAGTMADPLWRVRNIYTITDKSGRVIPFKPNWVQEQILEAIYVRGCRRLVVPKSRRHGVSTLFEIVGFDYCYFGEHIQMSIIDLTHKNASDKLTKITRFVWENIDPDIKEKLVADSSNVIEFANGSTINAGKQARGGQNQILHISEWGPIAHKDPERSQEIKTGALPSADEGIIWVESTFMGGKGGDFYEVIVRAQQTPDEQRTAKDFTLLFFGWWQDPRNSLEGKAEWISPKIVKYLDGIEAKLSIKLTVGQRLWYFKTSQEQGIFMWREYPSTLEEAVNAPVEGSIYGEIMSEIRGAGHIQAFSRDRGAPVFACWDLGFNDSMTVWLLQMVGRDVMVLWERTARHETMAIMHTEIERTTIPVMGHFLPHDGAHGNVVSGRVSPKVALEKAGAINVVVVPRVQNIWTGINLTRDVIARCWFNEPACTYGISALEAYHTKDETTNGVTSKDPVHDWSSHPSSALRTFAEAMELNLVKPQLARSVLMSPRNPDGDVIVDLEHIRQRSGSMFGKRGLAKSGSQRQ